MLTKEVKMFLFISHLYQLVLPLSSRKKNQLKFKNLHLAPSLISGVHWPNILYGYAKSKETRKFSLHLCPGEMRTKYQLNVHNYIHSFSPLILFLTHSNRAFIFITALNLLSMLPLQNPV